MTIKMSQLNSVSVARPESTSAHPMERRDFVVSMHPSDLEAISHAAYLMGTTVEDYLLIAAVQHARRVRIDLGLPRELVERMDEDRQADRLRDDVRRGESRYDSSDRLFLSGLALGSA